MNVSSKTKRCAWAGTDPLYIDYHDYEWGVPSHEDRHLFEMLILEGAQAGLSWITILKKREHFRQAFDGFDAHKMARYDQSKISMLMQNAGIIRNRLKIEAAVNNAQRYLEICESQAGFNEYIWQFVDGEPVINKWRRMSQIPVATPASELMSRTLKKAGFKFVGPTICYAYMQAVGMVNDHLVSCSRHHQLMPR